MFFRGYKHLGAVTTASLRFRTKAAARSHAAAVAEAALSSVVLCQSKFPVTIRVDIATAVQSALLYAAATWTALSTSQRHKIAVRYYSPFRKAVDGGWTKLLPRKPMCWDEVSAQAQRPKLEVALFSIETSIFVSNYSCSASATRTVATCG